MDSKMAKEAEYSEGVNAVFNMACDAPPGKILFAIGLGKFNS
jgi:hypothetical protein